MALRNRADFSTDKKVIVWQLTREDGEYGYPKKILHGHNHFVSDVVISSDGQFALSASWDKTLRLWDLNTGETARRFVGHTGDVLSVSFSADNRQIVSASRDRTIKLWNTLGECKFNITEDGHTEWVSCVRFSPNPMNPVIVSAGWDKVVKVSFVASPSYPVPTFDMMQRLYLLLQRGEIDPMRPLISPRSLIHTFRAFILHLCPLLLTVRINRFGSSTDASSRPTTSVTPATSTPSPSPPTDPWPLPVARTVSPCSGT